MNKKFKLPAYLLLTPIALFLISFFVIQIIYIVFHPPAVFDELTPSNTSTERFAYNVNGGLFLVISFAPIVALFTTPVGLTLLLMEHARSRHAKS